MKTKLTTAILFIILIILLGGIIILGGAMYIDLIGEGEYTISTINAVFPEEPKPEKEPSNTSKEPSNTSQNNNNTSISSIFENKIDIPSSTSSINNEINNFFYKQLTGNQIIIYDKLLQNKDRLKFGNYKIEFKNTFSSTLATEDGQEKLGDDYQTAIEAFLHDNPDIFYIDINKMYLSIETTTRLFTTTYNVFISPGKETSYLQDEFASTEQVETAIKEVEEAKNDIIKRLNGTTYKSILFIHDYLIDNIEYDSDYSGKGSYSIYGALVQKKCVCEGYAKALKYLLNAANIECEILQGEATNSSGQTESHAWNCVKLRRCMV